MIMAGIFKRKWIIALVCFILAVVIVCLIIFLNLRDTVKFDEQQSSLRQYLQETEGTEEIQILQTEKYLSSCAVAYLADDAKIHLMLFDKVDFPFADNRYRYSGKASSMSDISTYNFNESGETSLIIVYGVPQPDYGSYRIQTERTEYSTDITGESILDIYMIFSSSNSGAGGTVYDKAGKLLDYF